MWKLLQFDQVFVFYLKNYFIEIFSAFVNGPKVILLLVIYFSTILSATQQSSRAKLLSGYSPRGRNYNISIQFVRIRWPYSQEIYRCRLSANGFTTILIFFHYSSNIITESSILATDEWTSFWKHSYGEKGTTSSLIESGDTLLMIGMFQFNWLFMG